MSAAPSPRLSAVVVCHNMARELPRTIRTLSPSMQRDIEATDYEVIVVDNGSSVPFDEAECRRWIPELIVHPIAEPTVSPVPAINKGLELARGHLVGVFIDGARMATPGLLGMALAAARLHERPVIGTIAFHLGPDLQVKSVRQGYDQSVKDALLASCGWEEDGYRLFDISVLAASSKHGWFVLPSESNALFMPAAQWRELGGYDPAFVSAGGGLTNLDIWARACADPRNAVIMLLGEATFHQVHGGVATNAAEPTWPRFHAEYVRIRGESYRPPARTPLLFGRLSPHVLSSMTASLETLQRRALERDQP